MALTEICIRGAREHNLKGIDLDIPRDQLVVITGLSGSGKSTLAFDTIYAEGQRKYMESLSAYARQFLDQMQKPDVESIEGLPPTIAIEQRGVSHNPRSTVATTTEIYDYLRLLFARAGQPKCWHVDAKTKKTCGLPIESQSATMIIDFVCGLAEGTRLMVLAPVIRGKKGHHKEVFEAMLRQGFVRARVDGEIMDLREITETKAGSPFTTQKARYQKHSIEAVVDRIVIRDSGAGSGVSSEKDGDIDPLRQRVADAVELSLKLADGLVIISSQDALPAKPKTRDPKPEWGDTLFSENYACTVHPECSLEDLEPRLFSFNSPYGACPTCAGLGTVFEFDPDLVVPDRELPISGGAIAAWRQKGGKRMNVFYSRMIRKLCKNFAIDKDKPFKKLTKRLQRIVRWVDRHRERAGIKCGFRG